MIGVTASADRTEPGKRHADGATMPWPASRPEEDIMAVYFNQRSVQAAPPVERRVKTHVARRMPNRLVMSWRVGPGGRPTMHWRLSV